MGQAGVPGRGGGGGTQVSFGYQLPHDPRERSSGMRGRLKRSCFWEGFTFLRSGRWQFGVVMICRVISYC